MKLLSIDGATVTSGYAIFDKDNKTLLKYDKVNVDDKELSMRDRVIKMIDEFGKIIDTYNPDEIIMEEVPPAINNSSTVLALGILSGGILGLAHSKGIEIKYIPVPTWHSILGIKKSKGEIKEQSINWVNEYYGLDLKYYSKSSKKNQDNESDAIAIGSVWIGNYDKSSTGFGRR